jgi:GYF domain 2
MRSREIYEAVDRGELTPDTKVWRDGRACWLPIAECHELTITPPPRETREERPTISGVRRVERRSSAPEAEEPGEPASVPPARPALTLTASFAIGLVIGALLYLPFAW